MNALYIHKTRIISSLPCRPGRWRIWSPRHWPQTGLDPWGARRRPCTQSRCQAPRWTLRRLFPGHRLHLLPLPPCRARLKANYIHLLTWLQWLSDIVTIRLLWKLLILHSSKILKCFNIWNELLIVINLPLPTCVTSAYMSFIWKSVLLTKY